MYLLGYDIGSSSIKASIIDVETGKCISSDFYPKSEMVIMAKQADWGEQFPETWWDNLKFVTKNIITTSKIQPENIKGIGISYQMHGLVIIDKNYKVLRPSIIWCDSRAVPYGNKAFAEIGKDKCFEYLLNSPGNFTASKLKWVKDNEPDIFKQIYKIMLPGDYIAMKLTGIVATTVSGLSEGILWDFKRNTIADFLIDYYGFDKNIIPDILPTFDIQGELTLEAATELGLSEGTPVAYRAGDQPNNAFSLNVLNPGEIAATAGTSGVVYGVSDVIKYDPQSRINSFAHVNHSKNKSRLGILLCINGTGICNSWIKKNIGYADSTYEKMNEIASSVPVGSNGLVVLPFGNGAERMLGNKNIGCKIHNLNFNVHTGNHLIRASQEGIVFAFQYGMEIMKSMEIKPVVIRAGNTNMFLSPVFRQSLADISGAMIELYDTDGAQGAARGAGIGIGIYKSFEQAFYGLSKIKTIYPDNSHTQLYTDAYEKWRTLLVSEIV